MTNKILKRLEGAEVPTRGSLVDHALKGDPELAKAIREAYRKRGVPAPFIIKVIHEETGVLVSETAMRRWLSKGA